MYHSLGAGPWKSLSFPVTAPSVLLLIQEFLLHRLNISNPLFRGVRPTPFVESRGAWCGLNGDPEVHMLEP